MKRYSRVKRMAFKEKRSYDIQNKLLTNTFHQVLKKFLLSIRKNIYSIIWNEHTTYLTLAAPCISENCVKVKINAYKTFMKPFETLQKFVKIKIKVSFSSLSGIGAGRVKQGITDFLLALGKQ